MSYQVLARKWRPQTFTEMAGQDHVLQALVNALRQQRLHHAYLFTGTRGVGKTTIARIFAKCLNCETKGVSPEPCGTCSSCVEIAEGRFVDLIEVDAASRTKVEDTRELLENVQYAPTRGRFKVYLIDEVHMLSTHSFNALLKTLEEPPPHVKFLLATTDPQKLPVTVLSRCLQFNLKNMTSARVFDYLQQVLVEEKISFDEAALWQIGHAANGSMRDALSLTDQAIAFGDGHISESSVTSMLGLVNQNQILSLLEILLQNDAALMLQKVAELADYQPDFVAICASLMDVLHRIAIEQQVPGALENQLGDLERIQSMAAHTLVEDIQLLYQGLLIGRRDLHLAHSPKAGFEMLMLRLIAFRPASPVQIDQSQVPTCTAPADLTTEPARNMAEPVHNMDEPPAQRAETEENSIEPSVDGPAIDELVSDTPVSSAPQLGEQIADSVVQSVQQSQAVLDEPVIPAYQNDSERPPWEAPLEMATDAEPLPEAVAPTEFVANTAAQATDEMSESVAELTSNHQANAQLLDAPVSEQVSIVTETASKMALPKTTSLDATESSSETDATVDADVVPIEVVLTEVVLTEVVSGVSTNLIDAYPSEEVDDNEDDEQALDEILNPYNPAASLVDALSVPTEIEANDGVVGGAELSANQQKVVDTIAQPALAMTLPNMAHFSELTMQTWWLVAPRLALTGLVQNILMNSSLIAASESGLKLEVPLEYGHMLNQARYEHIQQSLSDFFAMPVPLIIDTVAEVAGVTAEEFAASKRAEALQAAIAHLSAHPIVQGLASMMGGQLIYETVKVKA